MSGNRPLVRLKIPQSSASTLGHQLFSSKRLADSSWLGYCTAPEQTGQKLRIMMHMRVWARVLTWTCIGLVSLPMSPLRCCQPCAYWQTVCGQRGRPPERTNRLPIRVVPTTLNRPKPRLPRSRPLAARMAVAGYARGTDGGKGGCRPAGVEYGIRTASRCRGVRPGVAAGTRAVLAGPDFASSLLPVALLIAARTYIPLLRCGDGVRRANSVVFSFVC